MYFVDKQFNFQPDVCNRCYDVLMMSINLKYVTVLNIKGADYHCINSRISKSETVNLLQKADLEQKVHIIKHKKWVLII